MIREPIRRRKRLRLEHYDYARAGAYFVTVSVQNCLPLFGEVLEGEMRLNDAGEMVHAWWDKLPEKYPNVHTDAFIIMPNHIHGIIIIHNVEATPRGRPNADGTKRPSELTANHGQPHGAAPTDDEKPILGDVVRWFKTMTTNAYIRGVRQQHWTPFDKRLWQRNYYEHIIRNDNDFEKIRTYINTNPLRWHLDEENPYYGGRVPTRGTPTR